MKRLTLEQQQEIRGGQLTEGEAFIIGSTALAISFLAGFCVGKVAAKKNTSNVPDNWEQVLDDNRTLFYEDGFMQGYMAGKSDGLTIAATGRDFW